MLKLEIIYFILYINLIFGLVPKGALWYIRPVFVSILSLLYWGPILILRKLDKKHLKIVNLLIINTLFFILLGEFGKVSVKISIILSVYISIGLILLSSNKKSLGYIGISLIGIFLAGALWQGPYFKYTSRLKSAKNIESKIIETEFGYSGNIAYVDASTYYKDPSPLSKWYDKKYWGIEYNALPLRGKIIYPEEKGLYPVIIVVHGNHLAEDLSHNGYDYLLKALAHNGYIAISVDQNFLNGNWTTLGVGYSKENDVRAKLILAQIKLAVAWNNNTSSPLYNMIDTEKIGLIGHSRGGEAVSIAAKIGGHELNIKGIVALAPTYGQYPKYIELVNISYIALHGTNDGDLKSFYGRKQYDRTFFTNDNFNIKASYYINGANHSNFNSDWGKIDATSIGKIYYGTNYLIKPLDQQEIAKELSLAFFDTILKGKNRSLNLKKPTTIPTFPELSLEIKYFDSSGENIKITPDLSRKIYKNRLLGL